jgi:hypothetical protein
MTRECRDLDDVLQEVRGFLVTFAATWALNGPSWLPISPRAIG